LIHDQKPSTNYRKTPIEHTTQKKWATFTHVDRETSYITNLFKNTELNMAFCIKNTIGNLLAHRHPAPDRYSLSGVYKLTCPDCNKAYIRQTGRKFTTQFLEHKKAFRSHSHNSSFAKHLDIEAHSFRHMHDIMQILHLNRKGTHLNTLERFHIHMEAAKNNHLNEGHTIYPNAIYDTLLKTHHHKNPSHPISPADDSPSASV